MIIERKLFTKYDESDRLKAMKDSDILAEDKRKKLGVGGVAGSTLGGATKGALIGAGVGTIAQGASNVIASGGFKPAFQSGGITKSLGGAAKAGALAGAAIGGLLSGRNAAKKRSEYNKEVNFYNKRLDYAKKKAVRRERKDWKNNMTNREGYTY